MRGMAMAVLVAVCGACGAPPHEPTTLAAEPTVPEDPAFIEHTAMLRATLARSSIVLDDEATIMTCESADAERKCSRCDVATGMDGIDPELVDRVALTLASYPDAMLRAARIERFALCRELRFVGTDGGPVGLAEPSKRRIMIGVGIIQQKHDGRGVEAVVHHEVFHLFDLATLGGAMSDPDWLAMQPRGFAYRDPAEPSEPPKGFVNAYATTNEMEDRASTYEHVMSDDELCTRMRRDPIVAAKVKLIGRRVAAMAGAAFVNRRVTCGGELKPLEKPRPKQPGKVDLKLPQRYRDSL